MATATAALNTTRTPLQGGDPDAPYLIPQDGQFGGDFIPADDIRSIAETLIGAEDVRFGFLAALDILYLWKRKGGKTKGKATLGKCLKASGLVGYLAHEAAFVVWVAADTAREYELTGRQMEAAVFHELSHISKDENGEPIAVDHDFAGFAAELDTYGAWQSDLKVMARSLRQMPLWADDDSGPED